MRSELKFIVSSGTANNCERMFLFIDPSDSTGTPFAIAVLNSEKEFTPPPPSVFGLHIPILDVGKNLEETKFDFYSNTDEQILGEDADESIPAILEEFLRRQIPDFEDSVLEVFSKEEFLYGMDVKTGEELTESGLPDLYAEQGVH